MSDELIQADAKLVNTWQSAAEVVLVDVRETNEYEYEHTLYVGCLGRTR